MGFRYLAARHFEVSEWGQIRRRRRSVLKKPVPVEMCTCVRLSVVRTSTLLSFCAVVIYKRLVHFPRLKKTVHLQGATFWEPSPRWRKKKRGGSCAVLAFVFCQFEHESFACVTSLVMAPGMINRTLYLFFYCLHFHFS